MPPRQKNAKALDVKTPKVQTAAVVATPSIAQKVQKLPAVKKNKWSRGVTWSK